MGIARRPHQALTLAASLAVLALASVAIAQGAQPPLRLDPAATCKVFVDHGFAGPSVEWHRDPIRADLWLCQGTSRDLGGYSGSTPVDFTFQVLGGAEGARTVAIWATWDDSRGKSAFEKGFTSLVAAVFPSEQKDPGKAPYCVETFCNQTDPTVYGTATTFSQNTGDFDGRGKRYGVRVVLSAE